MIFPLPMLDNFTHLSSKSNFYPDYRFYQGKDHDNSRSWYENELRLFIWTLVCYLYLNGSGLEEMVTVFLFRHKKIGSCLAELSPKKILVFFNIRVKPYLKLK